MDQEPLPQTELDSGATAHFGWFDHRAEDAGGAPAGMYRNPVLPGLRPDPALVRVGGDFYLVTSSFAWFPGIPVFHSRDLVTWTQIGNAIDRPGQIDMTGIAAAHGIFAPSIACHDGVFYILCTAVDCGGNFLVTATDPAGPWSDPVWLDFDGIDPSLFVDGDGRAYVLNNGPPPVARYDGHRAIWAQEIELAAGRLFGPRIVLVDGGVDIAAQPIWAEAPHVFRRGGFYYLITAEGGTGRNHSEVVYRSTAVTGPWEAGPRNPILTQRDLDPARSDRVEAAGHADFVELDDGSWWCVFLGSRPYAGDLTAVGRETFLLPVTWHDDWPEILPRGVPVPLVAARPDLPAGTIVRRERDDFAAITLAPAWLTLRTPRERWYEVGGGLTLAARAVSLGERGQPSFLGQGLAGAVSTTTTRLDYRPARDGDRAGVAAFQDERNHVFFGLARDCGRVELVVVRHDARDGPGTGRVIAATRWPAAVVRLRFVLRAGRCDFLYAGDDGDWRTLLADADADFLSMTDGGGFLGTVVGLYAARLSAPASPA